MISSTIRLKPSTISLFVFDEIVVSESCVIIGVLLTHAVGQRKNGSSSIGLVVEYGHTLSNEAINELAEILKLEIGADKMMLLDDNDLDNAGSFFLTLLAESVKSKRYLKNH